MRVASLPRTVLTGLVVPVAAATTGGAVLAGAGPAAAAARAAATRAAATRAAPACSVSWVGGASKVLWNLARNWSTGHVPGATSDVCITPFVIVTATGPVRIHSLHVGGESTVVFQGTPSSPSHVTIAATLDNLGNVELDNSSLTAALVNNPGGLESQGTSVLTSPALHNGGSVVAIAGSLTLPDTLAQLSNGALASGEWQALDNGVLELPGDITAVTSGLVGLNAGSAILDPAGNNALAGLASIGPLARLALGGGSLALSGSLVSDGALDIGGYAGAATLTVGGTLTEAQGTMSMASQSTVRATTVTIDHGSSLSASGTIEGNLVNDGSVGAASRLAVTGSYTQRVDGTLAAGFGSELQAAGKATLAGTLTASSFPPPAPGTRGTAITFGSLSGGFTGHNLGFNLVTLAHEIDVVAQPQIAVSPTTAPRGTTVTVSGGDFAYDSAVTLYLDQVNGRVLGAAQASLQGAFSVSVNVPWIPPGAHTIIAVGPGGRQAQTTITVT